METYDEVKGQMKTGDLLLYRSNSLVGSAIRLFSHGDVNHASMILRLYEYEGSSGRRWTTEAISQGTVLTLLSRKLEEYDGKVWWYPLDDSFSENDRLLIGMCALEYIGIPYDYSSLFRNIFGKVSTEARELFCSEYYYLCLGMDGKAPTPADLPKLGIFNKEVLIWDSSSK